MQSMDYLVESTTMNDQKSTTSVKLQTQLCARKSVAWKKAAMPLLLVWLKWNLHGDTSVMEEALEQLKL